jgi:hypothetical protein
MESLEYKGIQKKNALPELSFFQKGSFLAPQTFCPQTPRGLGGQKSQAWSYRDRILSRLKPWFILGLDYIET